METQYRVIRDPVYGYVHLPDRLRDVVDSPIFQRLRRIAQNSLAQTVYPSATGTRFEHALGTMQLAGKAWDSAWTNAEADVRASFARTLGHTLPAYSLPTRGDDVDLDAFAETMRLGAMGAGLLHDIGHPPLSHVLEPVYKAHAARIFGGGRDSDRLLELIGENGPQFHEAAGEWLLERFILRRLDAELQVVVGAVLLTDSGEASPLGAIHSLISSEIDVDRADYLVRDGRRTGTEYGSLDWERLTDAFRLGPYTPPGNSFPGFRIHPTVRARSAAEGLMLQRLQSYRWVYFHHRVVGTNLALASAVDLLIELAHDDSSVHVDGDGGAPAPRAVAELIGPCLGNLNYLNPSGADLRRVIGHAAADAVGADAVASAEAGWGAAEMVAAGVDDTTILRALLDARICAELILGSPTAPPATERLRRFCVYADVRASDVPMFGGRRARPERAGG